VKIEIKLKRMKERIEKIKAAAIVIWLAGFLVFMFSCEKYSFDPPEVDPNEEISFQEVLIPIFDNKCVGCHSGGIPPNLTADEAYESITDDYINDVPEESEIYTKLEEGHVTSITDIELQQILIWIQQGANNN
jgi:hypothetical protein